MSVHSSETFSEFVNISLYKYQQFTIKLPTKAASQFNTLLFFQWCKLYEHSFVQATLVSTLIRYGYFTYNQLSKLNLILNKRSVLHIGRVKIQIEIEKGWRTANMGVSKI